MTAAFLRQRVAAVVAAGHGNDLAKLWPADVPTFKQQSDFSEEQLAAIGKTISTVEQAYRLPFIENPDDTVVPFVAPVLVDTPPLPDEGPNVGADDVDAVRRAYDRLPDDRHETLDLLTGMAADAGHPLSLVNRPSLRRWEIARFLIAASALCMNDISALLDYPPSMGVAVGTLTIEQARRLRDAAEAFSAHHLRNEAMA